MSQLPQRIPGSHDIPDAPKAVPFPLVRLLAVHIALREWADLDCPRNSLVCEATRGGERRCTTG